MQVLLIILLLFSSCPSYGELILKVDGDPKVVFEQARDASESGDLESQYILGRMYGQGVGVEKNNVKAIYWLEKASDREHAEAQLILGTMYVSELENVPHNVDRGMMLITKAANQGLSEAKGQLASIYFSGRYGIDKDQGEAKKWMIDLAEDGDANAQYAAGLMYSSGQLVDRDIDKAITWWEKAANNGNSEALYNLGFIYYKGKLVPRDWVK
jgi:TPR repeat protein